MFAPADASAADEPLGRLEREMLTFLIRIDNTTRQSTLYERMERAAYRIARLLESCGPATVVEIARALELDASTVTRQVAAMEARQQATRRVHPRDGRAWEIHLTDIGRREMATITAGRRQRFSEWTQDWSTADVDRFGRLLERFNESVAAGR
jgi:DNA-binding MarR family transcriptional regulator